MLAVIFTFTAILAAIRVIELPFALSIVSTLRSVRLALPIVAASAPIVILFGVVGAILVYLAAVSNCLAQLLQHDFLR